MLQITSTPALIGIQTSNVKQSIQQPRPDVMLNIEHPRIEIDSELPKVKIDQYQSFAEAGLKNFLDLTRESAQIGQQAVMMGIERRARQGDELANIQYGFDAIPNQAVENAYELFLKEFNIGTVPKSRPDISLIEGQVNIKVHKGKVNMDVKINKPIIDYTKGKVDIYLRQRNSIDIQYIGSKFDKTV